jgi:hypothetical protein
MDKPPTEAKPSAEAEEAPDELDADAKPGAFDAEAKALDQRLRQLISDYAALFLRYPNVEGRPSVEVLEKMQVLAAIRVHPWREKLAKQASKFEREAFGEGQHVFLQMWIDGIPEILERGEWDVDFAARNLITTLPAPLRVRCPGYPALEDRDAFADATAAVADKIRDEVNDSKRCKDPDAIKIGRLALEALEYEGARHLRPLGSPKRRPKV